MSWSKCCRSVMVFLQYINGTWRCSTVVTVVEQTSYIAGASDFDKMSIK